MAQQTRPRRMPPAFARDEQHAAGTTTRGGRALCSRRAAPAPARTPHSLPASVVYTYALDQLEPPRNFSLMT